MKKRRILRLASLLLVGILMLSGCTGIDQDGHANQGPLGDDLICLDYNSYTGYVGGKYVFNVASILVKNQSETYLEYATLKTYFPPT